MILFKVTYDTLHHKTLAGGKIELLVEGLHGPVVFMMSFLCSNHLVTASKEEDLKIREDWKWGTSLPVLPGYHTTFWIGGSLWAPPLRAFNIFCAPCSTSSRNIQNILIFFVHLVVNYHDHPRWRHAPLALTIILFATLFVCYVDNILSRFWISWVYLLLCVKNIYSVF